MMRTTILFDEELKKALDAYCEATGIKMSDAIRKFVKEGIENHEKSQSDYKDSKGSGISLSANQQRGIRAAIECGYMIREMVGEDISNRAGKKASETLKDGWPT